MLRAVRLVTQWDGMVDQLSGDWQEIGVRLRLARAENAPRAAALLGAMSPGLAGDELHLRVTSRGEATPASFVGSSRGSTSTTSRARSGSLPAPRRSAPVSLRRRREAPPRRSRRPGTTSSRASQTSGPTCSASWSCARATTWLRPRSRSRRSIPRATASHSRSASAWQANSATGRRRRWRAASSGSTSRTCPDPSCCSRCSLTRNQCSPRARRFVVADRAV